MTFGELLDDERREGHAEGHAEGLLEGLAEGQSMFMMLIDAMSADGRTAEIPRLTKNQAFRETMFAQYHITADIGAIQKD